MRTILIGALAVMSLAAASADFYKIEGVRRVDKDLYKARSGVYIETRYCYHYAYGEDALYNDRTREIIWDDSSKCDVKRMFR